MLAAMNINQTTDADGTDELGIFRADVFKNGVYSDNMFYKDLSDEDNTNVYVKGWKQRFSGAGAEYTFEASADCFIRMTLEEIDTSSNQTCSIDVPCTNTPFSYAPCWI